MVGYPYKAVGYFLLHLTLRNKAVSTAARHRHHGRLRSKYSKSHVKISRSNRFTSSAVSPDASHQRYAPQKLDSPPALDLPQQHTEGLAVSAYLAGSARNRVRGVAPRAAVADAIGG